MLSKLTRERTDGIQKNIFILGGGCRLSAHHRHGKVFKFWVCKILVRKFLFEVALSPQLVVAAATCNPNNKCLTLKQLLYAEQQELLSNQHFFEKQLQPKGSKDLLLQSSKKSDRIVHGLHPDDENDSTISHLMQSLPDKKHISPDHLDSNVTSNDICDEMEQLQDGANQEFEEDLDDLIEDRDTP